MTYETITYGGWNNCHRLSNGIAELIVSGDFGPRVLRFSFTDGENQFHEQYDVAHATPEDKFRFFGGHRLWAAPEDPVRTYVPDNSPIRVSYADGVLSVVMDAEPVAQIEKTIDISLDPTSARAIVTHTLTNRGAWPVETAVWALSVMEAGGTAVLPLPPRAPHSDDTLLPTSAFILWPYSDFSDPRWTFASRAALLYADPKITSAQKIGAPLPDGWLAYWRDGTTFIKRVDYEAGAKYPDNNSSSELFTNGMFCELETLSPVVTLAPGASAEHVETWSLTRDLPAPTRETMDAYFAWVAQQG